MRRSALLGGTILGPAGMSAIPPAVTSAAAPTWPDDPLTIDDLREAARTLAMRGPAPSVIVVGDDVPDGLEVSAGGVAFLTLSREGLERIKDEATRDRISRHMTGPIGFDSFHGLPIVDLEKLDRSDDHRARTLAAYYRAAITGFRRGLER